MANRSSLRRKLVLLVVAAVGAATVVATSVSVWQQTMSFTALRKQQLVATAEVFASAVGPAVAARNARDAFISLRAVGHVHDIRYAEIRTADRRILATSGSAVRLLRDATVEAGGDVSLLTLLVSGTVQVTVPVLNAGERVGDLILIGGIADLWPTLMSTLMFTLLGGAGALGIGFLVATHLQRSITAPLASLIRAMTDVREKHTYDVSVADARDREIGELVSGFNQMLRDVRDRDERLETHRRNLETEVADRTRELRTARDAADSANRAKSEFLATMSHEIRTPMNGIMVMAEMLADSDIPKRPRRYADIIARSGQRLLAIIDDILDFSKVEAGKLALERVPLDLNDLVESVVGLFSERARGKGVDLAAIVDPALPRQVFGDPVRLAQVMTNLINNALKFTERGFVKVAIACSSLDPSKMEIRVSDSGLGIREDKLATIFDAFSQADQSTTRRFGGTGLGLAICQRLVQAMGGTLHAKSAPGEGSQFSVVMPCEAARSQPWPDLAPSCPGSAICILDVDGPATSSALACYLGAAGYTVIPGDATSAIDRHRGASLICIDADRAALLRLADLPARPIVIAVCASGSDASERLIVTGQADAAITKPVLRTEIEDLLRRIVDGELILQPMPPDIDRKPSTAFRAFKVLVADDDAINREVAREALSGLGARVEVVKNGAEAVQALEKAAFDIVFMDGSMPEVDGFEATRRLREREAHSGRDRTPVVALTAHVVGVAAEEWRRAGMDDVIYKPFTIEKLVHSIRKLLPDLAEVDQVEIEPMAAPIAGPEQRPWQLRTMDRPPLLAPTFFDQLKAMRLEDQNGFAKRIVALYAEHAPRALDDIEQALDAGDRERCRRAAHALKSMSYNLGAARVASLAQQIEMYCAGGNDFPQAAVRRELAEAIEATLVGIRAESAARGDTDRRAADKSSGARPAKSPLELALVQALDRDQISVLYQPIVDRYGLRTCGVEALARWTQESGEVVSPGVFIPAAERIGLIHELGERVLRRACEEAANWPSIFVSVNVSPIQFSPGDLSDRIDRIAAQAGIDRSRLKLEITETALLQAERPVLETMRRLNARGITFALDDFGTGYSSLTFLRRFPIQAIKIDRSFITNLDTTVDATIVHAIVSIGRSLGLNIVAEGIEHPEQQRFLAAAGVHFMQGFLFGRPMSKDGIVERLRQEQQSHADEARAAR